MKEKSLSRILHREASKIGRLFFTCSLTYLLNLIFWDNDWWMTGMMSGWAMSETEKKKVVNEPSNFWTHSEGQQQRLKENTTNMHLAFRDLFGADFVLFSNKKEFEQASKDLMQHYIKMLKLDEKIDAAFEQRKKKYKELYNLRDEMDISFLSSSDGLGLFFIKKVGMITLIDIQDIIILQKKKNLTKQEEVDLFFSLTVNVMPEVAEYLLHEFGKENFKHPVDASQIDVYKNRHFYWRFFHPEEYGLKVPNMSEVDMGV